MARKIGLALSGGGARGAAHVGLIKALEEYEIEVSVVAGTSAGAIVGALFAAGNSADDILKVFKEVELFDFSNFTFGPGFLKTENYLNVLAPYLGENTFEDLHRKLYLTASDLLAGELRVFSEGKVSEAVLSSAAFPGVFTPVRNKQGVLVDGGVFNNLPADLIRKECDFVIGMDLNPITPVEEKDVDNMLEIMRRVLELMIRKQSKLAKDHCDLYICDDRLGGYATFDMSKADELFELGYEIGTKALGAYSGEAKGLRGVIEKLFGGGDPS
jgi:NTE family protein